MSNLFSGERFSLAGGPEPDQQRDFETAVLQGLSQSPKRLPCRYLYDARGSELFDEICLQPEYYPTRTETAILADLAGELMGQFTSEPRLVELGSGSAQKTRIVIEAILERYGHARFEPIDVSRSAIEGSAAGLLKDYPQLEVHAVADGYLEGLQLLAQRGEAPLLVLWLGSSIGNFHREEAGEFLAEVRAHLTPSDRLMVGFDLRKGKARLEAAYDDGAGVTKRFIRNLLTRINRELGGDFPVEDFLYEASYDEDLGRVEMWLESPKKQTITLSPGGQTFQFEQGERIHMENSYKYSRAEIEAVGRKAGLTLLKAWSDPEELFCEALFGLE